jgi:hypothetical protein
MGSAGRVSPKKGVKRRWGGPMTPEVKNENMTLGRQGFLVVAGATPSSLRLSRWTRANSGALGLPEQSRDSLAGARSSLSILGNGLCRSPLLGELRKNSLAGRHMNFLALRAAIELSVFRPPLC